MCFYHIAHLICLEKASFPQIKDSNQTACLLNQSTPILVSKSYDCFNKCKILGIQIDKGNY